MVDGADISCHDVCRPGGRNGDVEVADDAGVVRGDGITRRWSSDACNSQLWPLS